MHLDTVFTFCDRDVATLYEPVVEQILPILFKPGGEDGITAEISERSFLDEVREALGIENLKLVPTAGDEFEAEETSGTTATTSSRWRRVWSSPTSATSPRTRGFRRRGSRFSPSRARSWAAVAAAATA